MLAQLRGAVTERKYKSDFNQFYPCFIGVTMVNIVLQTKLFYAIYFFTPVVSDAALQQRARWRDEEYRNPSIPEHKPL
jgi:hypothetical protein